MTMLNAALTYADKLHLHVLPLNGKIPIIKHGVSEASRDPEQIKAWWTQWPNANIGLRGGPGAFVAIDIDPHKGGEHSLGELQHKYGPLPDTWEAITGSGGTHLYYVHPNDGPPIHNSVESIAPGIDIRATQGYCVAPPSIHPDTGRRYEWDGESHPLEIQPAICPDWLVTLCRTASSGTARTPQEWREHVEATVAQGARNQSVTQLVGLLLRRGIDPVVACELAQAWNQCHCQPPLPDSEVIKIVTSIAAKELRRRNGQ